MDFFIWIFLLFMQAISFTFASRARNSGSVGWSFAAALFSNGMWFGGQFFTLDQFLIARDTGAAYAWLLAVVYTLTMSIGNAACHWILLNKVERGSKRVGAHR